MDDDLRDNQPGDARELVAATPGRIDAVLASAFPDISRARLQRLIAAGHVTVNGQPLRKSAKVAEGDTIGVVIPETPHPAPTSHLCIPILFEDDYLLVVDKPAGLAVHGAPGDTGPSVALWMLERLGPAAGAFDVERPGIVHRLDKDTSGVLLLAKTPTAQAKLSRAFEERTTKKTYLAVTDGLPDRPHAVIDAPIARHPGERTRMAIGRHGREARTEYEELGRDNTRAFLLLRPETGRTHQIRVHLAAIQAPVAFDRVYGRPGDGRQMLHAWRLALPHPAGGTLTVTAPIPPDFSHTVRSMHLDQLALTYEQPHPPTLETQEALTGMQ